MLTVHLMLAQVNVEWLMHFIIQMLSHKMKDNYHLYIYLGNLVNWKKKIQLWKFGVIFESTYVEKWMADSKTVLLLSSLPLHPTHAPSPSFYLSFYFLPLVFGSPLHPCCCPPGPPPPAPCLAFSVRCLTLIPTQAVRNISASNLYPNASLLNPLFLLFGPWWRMKRWLHCRCSIYNSGLAVFTSSGVHWACKLYWISEPVMRPPNPNSRSLLGFYCS